MAKYDYSKRLDSLKKRRQGDELVKKSITGKYEILTESYEHLSEASTIKYVIGAMLPVDAEYTKNTFTEAERVQNHLQGLKEKGFNIEFKYQGSVTNNTHIRRHSDIDILTLHLGFINLEPPQSTTSPYKGNPVQELCNLRDESFGILKKAFPAVDIDNSGAKSICLKGGSLKRKVDVVPSNWYDTILYSQTNKEYYRGVMILDYKEKKQVGNTPFYHNKLLNDKDSVTAMNYKKVVRLLKTIKADSDQTINLSSYDIASLIYHMGNNDLLIGKSPLKLLRKSLDYMKFVYENHVYRNGLLVPDKSRSIFEPNRATNNDLGLLIIELEGIYEDLLDDLKILGNNLDKEIIA
ncbi:hypothetical protein [Paenibacillus sinopodophylli]|uniref:hypothetical protein n=1 Tax=Paenibacillus sinopodophylli TaxID=1837342 RepID=UPI00110CE04A|nr:hypothetical protein [Paenibacillus sinopodophylli]